jgi:hypothetical protein
VGALNDALAPSLGTDVVRWSLLGAAVIGAASALFFHQCARTLREDLHTEDRSGEDQTGKEDQTGDGL